MSDVTRQRPSTLAGLTGALRLDGYIIRLIVIVITLFVVFSLIRPESFPTGRNLRSMAFQASEIGILAIAVSLTMLTGGIDLSINSTANLTGIIAGLILTDLMPAEGGAPFLVLMLAYGAALLLGLICGLFNGALIAYVGIPPILATLGTLTLYQGIATAITKGATVFGVSQSQFVGNGNLLGIPMPLIMLVMIAFVMGVVLTRTRYGFEVYMLGTNAKAARFSGINNTAVILRTYALSGLLSAIAGIVILGRTNSANVDFGASYVLLAILIAVLGGIDPYGGSGRLVGVLLAVIALQFLSTGLNMALFEISGANFFKEFAWGAVLVLVLVLNYLDKRRQSRRRV
ncbi:MAG: ABC transporter permease [Anaerolineae bacterium]